MPQQHALIFPGFHAVAATGLVFDITSFCHLDSPENREAGGLASQETRLAWGGKAPAPFPFYQEENKVRDFQLPGSRGNLACGRQRARGVVAPNVFISRCLCPPSEERWSPFTDLQRALFSARVC